MVEALKRVRERFRIACITNNMPAGHGPSMTRSPETAAQVAQIMALFEHVVESSKLNMRKPDPRIYRHACDLLGVAPEACVYLDDLGINLKPARAMGMATIKVETARRRRWTNWKPCSACRCAERPGRLPIWQGAAPLIRAGARPLRSPRAHAARPIDEGDCTCTTTSSSAAARPAACSRRG